MSQASLRPAPPPRAPVFPPLMRGLACSPADPFVIAREEAERGTDPGLILWSLSEERLRAAVVLAPEMPLAQAMAALRAAALALQNAFGNLAPPETSMQFDWSGGIRVNAGHCGGFHVACSTRQPRAEPDWMVIGLDLTLALTPEWEPGETPEWTALMEEGCGEVNPLDLLEYWSRHLMGWLNRLEEPGGRRALHRDWAGYAWARGGATSLPLDGRRLGGIYLGEDEDFGMLLRTPEGDTRLIPLTVLLEEG